MKTLSLAFREFCITAALSVSMLFAAAPVRADELDSVLKELASANDELVVFAKKAKPRFDESQLVKARHETELKALKAEAAAFETELAKIETERPNVDRLCTGTYKTQSELAAAQARCTSVLEPFNNRVSYHNSRLLEVQKRYDNLVRREEARAKDAREMLQKVEQLTKRVQALQQQAAVAARTRCVAELAQKLADQTAPLESLSQAQAICFDNASRQIAVAIGQTPPAPTWSATPNRTPEQAIEDYKNSGRKQPRQRIQGSEPPPPPVSEPKSR